MPVFIDFFSVWDEVRSLIEIFLYLQKKPSTLTNSFILVGLKIIGLSTPLIKR